MSDKALESVSDAVQHPRWSARRWHRREVFDGVLGVVMLAAALLLSWMAIRDLSKSATPLGSQTSPAPVPDEPVSIVGAAFKGSTAATVALIVYADFQCPYCAKFAREVLPEIEKTYVESGRVRIVFKHLPLETIHPLALGAARAAECAAEQGRFWPMHDLLFKTPTALSPETYSAYARDLRLNEQTFALCAARTVVPRISTDAGAAATMGINSTPTLLIGSITPGGFVRVAERINGAAAEAVVATTIDKVLSVSKPTAR